MSKGTNNNGNSRKPNSYTPYDTNNSIVRRITNRVSEILPQHSWISKYWSSSTSSTLRNNEEEEEEERQESVRKKRCLNPPHYSRENCDLSPILASRNDDGAIPGPSGLQRRNFVFSTPASLKPETQLPKFNGGDDRDSDESTSGCSSLIEKPMDKSFPKYIKIVPERPRGTPSRLTETPQYGLGTRPVSVTPRFTKPSHNKSGPSFDSYVFNSSLNKSSSFNSRLNDSSPFYKGRTMYGGASSSRDILSSSFRSQVSSPKIVSVKAAVNPETTKDTIGTSALKILKALEQFSTPVEDTRPKTEKSFLERRKRRMPKPYQELAVPKVSDLLRVKRRERTQSQSSTQSQHQPAASLPPPTREYFIREDDSSLGGNYVGPIKGKKKETLESERVQEVKLPNISLPITSLPTFDFVSLPLPSAPRPEVTPVAPKPAKPSKSRTPTKMVFSDAPVATSDGHSVKSIKMGFKFSEATNVEAKPKKIEKEFKIDKPIVNNIDYKINDKIWTCVKCKVDDIKDCKCKVVTEMKTKDKKCIKCGCMSELTVCSVCSSSKKPITSPIKEPLINSFKKPEGSWECNVCLVSNKSSDSSCVCCSTTKPGSEIKTNSLPKIESQNTTPTLNSWFKKPSGWECGTCMINNKEDSTSCVACETPKPGHSAPKKNPPAYQLEIPATQTFTFGIPKDSAVEKPAENVNFTFGTSTGKIENNFTFGIPLIEEEKVELPKILKSPASNFGSDKNDNSPDDKPKKRVSFNVPEDKQSSLTTSTLFGSSEAKAAEVKESTLLFSKPSVGLEAQPPVLKLGSMTSVSSSTDSTIKTNEVVKSPSFSTPDSLSQFGTDKKESIFGSVESKTIFNNEPKPASFVFGSTSALGTNIEKEPVKNNIFGDEPVFGKSDKPQTFFNSTTDNKIFQVNDAKPIFGSKPENNTFSLGNSNAFTSTGGFSMNNTAPENKPFVFNSMPQPQTQTNQTPFLFKANDTKPGGFQFQPPNQNSFGFNEQPQQQTFGAQEIFNQPSTFNSQPTPGLFTFGAAAHTEQPQPTFNAFTSQVTNAPPTQNMFAFGSQNAMTAQAPQPMQPPTFDPNRTPNFNFSGGTTPQFSATPTLGSPALVKDRKIRKAVRRVT